jgi:hypothetical protein
VRESIPAPESSHYSRRQSGPNTQSESANEGGRAVPWPPKPKRPSNNMGLSHQPASDDDASRRDCCVVASGGGGRARNHHPSSTHPAGVVPGRAARSRRRFGSPTSWTSERRASARDALAHTHTRTTAPHYIISGRRGVAGPRDSAKKTHLIRAAISRPSDRPTEGGCQLQRGGRVSVRE